MTDQITFKEIEEMMKRAKDKHFWKDANVKSVVNELSQAEIKSLSDQVDSWSDETFKSTQAMLDEYFGLSYVPTDILKAVVKNNLVLGFEIYDNAVTDTCVRDTFISAILAYVGAPDWPTYGDSIAYRENFYNQLPAKLEAVGIKNRGLPNFA